MNTTPIAAGAKADPLATAAAGQRPALREPMVWLLIGLPLASMVFAFWLLWAAVRTDGADDLGENVKRTGEAQVADLGPDARARELGLVAVLRVGDNGVEVYPAQGSYAHASSLVLTLRHPTDARQDRSLRLVAAAIGWQVAGAIDRSHDWRVQLTSNDGHWRLRGRLPAGRSSVRLEPSVGGP